MQGVTSAVLGGVSFALLLGLAGYLLYEIASDAEKHVLRTAVDLWERAKTRPPQ